MNVKAIGSNQTEIITAEGARILVSYSTAVAAVIRGHAYRTATNHSRTTSRHINAWLTVKGFRVPDKKPQSWFDSLLTATPARA